VIERYVVGNILRLAGGENVAAASYDGRSAAIVEWGGVEKSSTQQYLIVILSRRPANRPFGAEFVDDDGAPPDRIVGICTNFPRQRSSYRIVTARASAFLVR